MINQNQLNILNHLLYAVLTPTIADKSQRKCLKPFKLNVFGMFTIINKFNHIKYKP